MYLRNTRSHWLSCLHCRSTSNISKFCNLALRNTKLQKLKCNSYSHKNVLPPPFRYNNAQFPSPPVFAYFFTHPPHLSLLLFLSPFHYSLTLSVPSHSPFLDIFLFYTVRFVSLLHNQMQILVISWFQTQQDLFLLIPRLF